MADRYVHRLDGLVEVVRAAVRPEEAARVEQIKVSRDFWDEDWTYEEQEAIRDEFCEEFRAVSDEIARAWGPPNYVGEPERRPYPGLPGGQEVAYWRRGDCLAGVCWDHQDKEFPFILNLVALGPAAIASSDEAEYRATLEWQRHLFAWCLVQLGGYSAEVAERKTMECYPYEAPDDPARGIMFHDMAWHYAMLLIHGSFYWRSRPDLAFPSAEYNRESHNFNFRSNAGK